MSVATWSTVVGQLAVEVRGLGQVVSDPAGRAELGERGPDPIDGQARAFGEQAELQGGLEVEQDADQVGVVGSTSSPERSSSTAPSPENPRQVCGDRASV